MNWALVAVAAVIAAFMIIGLRRGFIKMLFSLVSVILIGVLTFLIAPHVNSFLKERTTWDDSVRAKTEAFFLDSGIIKSSDEQIDVTDLNLPVKLQEQISEDADSYIDKGYQAYNNYIVDTSAGLIFSGIVYIAVFLVIWLLVTIVSMILNLIAKLPVLKQVNRVAGMILGLVMGLIVVWILFLLLTVLGNTQFAGTVFEQIQANPILRFLYENNLVLYLIQIFF
ncbi:MAG: CvpA family protein [Butyrivibrio sp.]